MNCEYIGKDSLAVYIYFLIALLCPLTSAHADKAPTTPDAVTEPESPASLAEIAAEAEAKAECFNDAAEKNNKGFGELSTQFAGSTALVTTEIFRGFTAWSHAKSSFGTLYPKALGIRATASAPASTSTESDYGNASLLLRDGALIGLTFSLMGSPFWSHWYSAPCVGLTDKADASPKWGRDFKTDRTYLALHPVVDELAKPYFLHGLTLKALNNGLVKEGENDDSDDQDGSDLSGAATFYVGFGFDGPVGLFNSGGDKPLGSPAGTIDLNVGWEYTQSSTSSLRKVLNNDAIEDDSYSAIFASLRLQITNKFHVDIEHVAPDKSKDFLEEITAFKIGYKIQ